MKLTIILTRTSKSKLIDPTEMTVGQMLGRHGSDDENDFGYGYDEEDY